MTHTEILIGVINEVLKWTSSRQAVADDLKMTSISLHIELEKIKDNLWKQTQDFYTKNTIDEAREKLKGNRYGTSAVKTEPGNPGEYWGRQITKMYKLKGKN